MLAKFHLFEHDKNVTNSTLFKNLNQSGEPLYIRFDDEIHEDRMPCDLLIVHQTENYNIGDSYLIYYPISDSFFIDTLKTIVKMSDLQIENLNDVFIGNNGSISSTAFIHKIIASTIGFDNETNLDIISACDLAKYVFKYNTGDEIEYVDVETLSKENINKTMSSYNLNYFDLTEDDIDDILSEVRRMKETIKLDEEGCIIINEINRYSIEY